MSYLSKRRNSGRYPLYANCGNLEIDGRNYEFLRLRGKFCLRFTTPDGTDLKIQLKRVSRNGNQQDWLPVNMYYVREDGNRHVDKFGRFATNTFLDAMTASKLTSTLRMYGLE